MKRLLLSITYLSIYLFFPLNGYSVAWPCEVNDPNPYFRCAVGAHGGRPVKEFSRTYLMENHPVKKIESRINRKTGLRSNSKLRISYNDFLEHLATNKNRLVRYIPPENSIKMEVQGIDEEGNDLQEWIMPNFNEYDFLELSLEHVELGASGFQDSFPNLTHAVYSPDLNLYELYELSPDDLFLYGFGGYDENNRPYTEDYYSAMSVVPLEWGIAYEGIITFLFEEDPELDSIQYFQYFDVVANGTLQTYDDGPVNALKIMFHEDGIGYKDGIPVFEDSYDEIIWYSEEGHFLRAGIKEGSPLTGQLNLDYLEYQKISSKMTTSTYNLDYSNYKTFPNPVKTGQSLSVEIGQKQALGSVSLMDLQGKVLHEMDLSGLGKVDAFNIQIPNNIPNGLYFYRLDGAKGVPIHSGKLQIIQ